MALNSATTPVPAKSAQAANGKVVALGRLLFSAIFLLSGPLHFLAQTVRMAEDQGVPGAALAVPISGLLAIAGGLSVLLGYRTKTGAWALVLFLVPVTLSMHPFWAAGDPEAMRL